MGKRSGEYNPWQGKRNGETYNPWMGKRGPAAFLEDDGSFKNFDRFGRSPMTLHDKKNQYQWARLRKNQYQWGRM